MFAGQDYGQLFAFAPFALGVAFAAFLFARLYRAHRRLELALVEAQIEWVKSIGAQPTDVESRGGYHPAA